MGAMCKHPQLAASLTFFANQPLATEQCFSALLLVKRRVSSLTLDFLVNNLTSVEYRLYSTVCSVKCRRKAALGVNKFRLV